MWKSIDQPIVNTVCLSSTATLIIILQVDPKYITVQAVHCNGDDAWRNSINFVLQQNARVKFVSARMKKIRSAAAVTRLMPPEFEEPRDEIEWEQGAPDILPITGDGYACIS